jgi:hypothetical protein
MRRLFVFAAATLVACGGSGGGSAGALRGGAGVGRTLVGPLYSGFGRAVAIDGLHVVVGACLHGTYAGRVYHYDLSGAGTVPDHTFGGEAAYDYFGYSVAIDGEDVAVGAPMATTYDGLVPNPQAGKAYLLRLGTGQTFGIDGGDTNDHFGQSVALGGSRLVVGAYRYGTNYAGRIGVYGVPPAGAPVAAYTIEGDEGSTFGWSVAVDGEVGLVGAGGDQAVGEGSAAAFDLSGPAWMNGYRGEEDGDRFGRHVDVRGHFGVVGAPRAGAAVNAGRAYRYDLLGMPPVPLTIYETGVAGDGFGCSVAITEEYVLVGAWLADDPDMPLVDTGRAFLFDAASGALLASFIGSEPGERLGCAVDVDGDVAVLGCYGAAKVYVVDLPLLRGGVVIRL